MTNKELISELAKLPPDAQVGLVYDGALRSNVEFVWLTRSGQISLCSYGEHILNVEDLPVDAICDKYTTPCKEED